MGDLDLAVGRGRAAARAAGRRARCRPPQGCVDPWRPHPRLRWVGDRLLGGRAAAVAGRSIAPDARCGSDPSKDGRLRRFAACQAEPRPCDRVRPAPPTNPIRWREHGPSSEDGSLQGHRPWKRQAYVARLADRARLGNVQGEPHSSRGRGGRVTVGSRPRLAVTSAARRSGTLRVSGPGGRRQVTIGHARVDASRRAPAWTAGGVESPGAVRGPGTDRRKETPMRSLRTSLAAACLFAVAPAVAGAQSASPVAKMLQFQPILKGVEYDVPADPAAVDACKVETVYNAQKKADRLRPPRRPGQAPPPVHRHRRQRQDGPVELLPGRLRGLPRERPEQRPEPRRGRWMNTGGTRVATVVQGQDHRLEADLGRGGVEGLRPGARLGRPRPARDRDGHARGARPRWASPRARSTRWPRPPRSGSSRSRRSRRSWLGWNSKTVWNRLDGLMPHLIPADAATGLTQDLDPVRERGDLRRPAQRPGAGRARWRSSRSPR